MLRHDEESGRLKIKSRDVGINKILVISGLSCLQKQHSRRVACLFRLTRQTILIPELKKEEKKRAPSLSNEGAQRWPCPTWQTVRKVHETEQKNNQNNVVNKGWHHHPVMMTIHQVPKREKRVERALGIESRIPAPGRGVFKNVFFSFRPSLYPT